MVLLKVETSFVIMTVKRIRVVALMVPVSTKKITVVR